MMEKFLFPAVRTRRVSFPKFLPSPARIAFVFQSTRLQTQLILFLGVVAGVLAVPSLQAQPSVIFLKNGDRISGTIISEDTNRITVSNLWSKEIIIPLTDVSRREKV